MQDTALYQYLLGLQSPWTVRRVYLNVTGQCVDVPSLRQDAAALRSRRGAELATSRQLPVPDPPARAHPTGGMRCTRGGPGHGAVGGVAVAVHTVV